MKKLIGILGIGLLVILTIVLVKTFTNNPGAHQKSTPLEAIPSNAIAHMSEAIQIQTETPNDAMNLIRLPFLPIENLWKSLIH